MPSPPGNSASRNSTSSTSRMPALDPFRQRVEHGLVGDEGAQRRPVAVGLRIDDLAVLDRGELVEQVEAADRRLVAPELVEQLEDRAGLAHDDVLGELLGIHRVRVGRDREHERPAPRPHPPVALLEQETPLLELIRVEQQLARVLLQHPVAVLGQEHPAIAAHDDLVVRRCLLVAEAGPVAVDHPRELLRLEGRALGPLGEPLLVELGGLLAPLLLDPHQPLGRILLAAELRELGEFRESGRLGWLGRRGWLGGGGLRRPLVPALALPAGAGAAAAAFALGLRLGGRALPAPLPPRPRPLGPRWHGVEDPVTYEELLDDRHAVLEHAHPGAEVDLVLADEGTQLAERPLEPLDRLGELGRIRCCDHGRAGLGQALGILRSPAAGTAEHPARTYFESLTTPARSAARRVARARASSGSPWTAPRPWGSSWAFRLRTSVVSVSTAAVSCRSASACVSTIESELRRSPVVARLPLCGRVSSREPRHRGGPAAGCQDAQGAFAVGGRTPPRGSHRPQQADAGAGAVHVRGRLRAPVLDPVRTGAAAASRRDGGPGRGRLPGRDGRVVRGGRRSLRGPARVGRAGSSSTGSRRACARERRAEADARHGLRQGLPGHRSRAVRRRHHGAASEPDVPAVPPGLDALARPRAARPGALLRPDPSRTGRSGGSAARRVRRDQGVLQHVVPGDPAQRGRSQCARRRAGGDHARRPAAQRRRRRRPRGHRPARACACSTAAGRRATSPSRPRRSRAPALCSPRTAGSRTSVRCSASRPAPSTGASEFNAVHLQAVRLATRRLETETGGPSATCRSNWRTSRCSTRCAASSAASWRDEEAAPRAHLAGRHAALFGLGTGIGAALGGDFKSDGKPQKERGEATETASPEPSEK